MHPLQICIGPSICIGQESWCLPYAGFFSEGLHDLGYYSVKKSCLNPNRLGVRAFQSCHGVWPYSWVFRVLTYIGVQIHEDITVPGH